MAYNDFKRYVWLINQLRCSEDRYGGMTFKQINEAWQDSPLNPEEGKSLPRRTFHNHIDAIREIFGINIELHERGEGKEGKEGKYRISYLEGKDAANRQGDLIAMLSLNEMAERLKGMGSRILYEEPTVRWPEWLDRVVRAMKEGKQVELMYRKFGEKKPTPRVGAPYCLKLFKRRWYLLAREDGDLKTFALDRRTMGVRVTDKGFRMPKSFDGEEYFQDAFGVTVSKPQRVLVKAFGRECDYWRSAPVHISQKEIITSDDDAIFELYVGTESWEFIQELLSRGDRIEVLEPESLRMTLAKEIEKMKGRYADIWQKRDGGSEKNSDIGTSKKPNTMKNTNVPVWDTQAAAMKAAKGSFAGKSVRVDVYKSNNEIFAAGGYKTDSGKIVALPGEDDPMLRGTIVYSKRFWLSKSGPCYAAGTETKVVNDDSFHVAKQMLDEGFNPAVLNLADCYTACGWYPRGSNAQEESLCRVSTLSRSLYQYYTEDMAATVGVPFKGRAYPLDYHSGGIYSPGVTVFRDGFDNFRLLEAPYKVGVISVAALNFRDREGHPARDGKYRSEDGGFTPEGLEIMQDKIRTIYRIALVNGHDSVVLGAFGCGAFRLKSEIVARLFYDILEEDEFLGRFKEVRFAILERGTPGETGLNGRFRAFYELFEE